MLIYASLHLSVSYTGHPVRASDMNHRSEDFGRQRQIDFGSYLRDLRESRKLSQKGVAKELRINLCDIEKGNRPASVDLLIELSKKYDEPIEKILERKYWPQLSLLTGILRPNKVVVEELLKDLATEEFKQIQEEVSRYTAFLLLSRSTVNRHSQ